MVTYRTLCKRCTRYAIIGQAYRRWYRVARAVIRRLADHHTGRRPGTDFWHMDFTDEAYTTLCDIVAITSPRVTVKRNLRYAWGEFTGKPRPGDMMRSTRVALDHYYKTGEIRGPKTSRFAQVLRGDDDVVVVDSWMARALGVPDRKARNKSMQELANGVMRSVRRSIAYLGRDTHYWPLAEVQAAVWAGMIRTHYDRGKVPIMRVEDVGFERAGSRLHLSDTPF
jgi:hypothetical protein